MPPFTYDSTVKCIAVDAEAGVMGSIFLLRIDGSANVSWDSVRLEWFDECDGVGRWLLCICVFFF